MGKLEKLALSGGTPTAFRDGAYYYCLIDNYRALRTIEPLEGVAYEGEVMKIIVNTFEFPMRREHRRIKLPSLEEVKEGIAREAGRSRKTVVLYHDAETGYFIDARYLRQAIEALNVTEGFRSDDPRGPVFFYQDDDILSGVCGVVMPYTCYMGEHTVTGFFTHGKYA